MLQQRPCFGLLASISVYYVKGYVLLEIKIVFCLLLLTADLLCKYIFLKDFLSYYHD